MKTNHHSIYVYQIIQSVIVLAFGIYGIVSYLASDPIHTVFILITGYLASFLFMFACSSLSTGTPIHDLVFKEL
jgi:hypothetical protein